VLAEDPPGESGELAAHDGEADSIVDARGERRDRVLGVREIKRDRDAASAWTVDLDVDRVRLTVDAYPVGFEFRLAELDVWSGCCDKPRDRLELKLLGGPASAGCELGLAV
jgi:hypothetical protein